MRERIRHDASLRLLLQRVIPDCCRRMQRRIDVARIEEMFGSIRAIGPDAREAIRLQFQPDG